MKRTPKGFLADRAIPRAEVAVWATPAAGRTALEVGDDIVQVWVTEPAEDGRANEAIRRLLARALGVAPGRLTLMRGAASRDKRFRLD
jgi:uncharacterized protein YggU (UPF0235/DUF167 family)